MKTVLNTSKLTGTARVNTAQRGIGSFLTFDLFYPSSELSHENYHLWIYLANWEISQNEQVVLDSSIEDSREYKKFLKLFLGKKLTKFSIKDEKVLFEFGEYLEITLSPDVNFYDEDDELFMFFDRRKKTVASYSPKTKLLVEPIEQS